MPSRRNFVTGSAAALSLAAAGVRAARASPAPGPLGLPIGLQLYSVREAVAEDLAGTLRKVAQIGYGEVEFAGMPAMPAAQLRALLAELGLNAPSMHSSMADLQTDLTHRLDYAHELGAKYLVCSFPSTADGRFLHAAGAALPMGIRLDDWYWNADQLNRIGELAKSAGMRCAYHNHNLEFRTFDGMSAYEALLRRTSPALITMELDIAWVVTAGVDPSQLLREHGARISLLHIKDVRKDAHVVQDRVDAQTTELGAGRIDWPRVFASVTPGSVSHYFVEQENFTGTPLQAAKINFEFLRQLKLNPAG
jgi:sugar phosphate isomerase/epimerase